MRAGGVQITEVADIAQFRNPLIEMNKQYFSAKGPKVKAVFDKMLSLSSF
jgi:hypothetical protein